MPVHHNAQGAGLVPAPAQTLAIEHVSGPIQVLAGPGSGKTYLTIRRIRHLICHHGISPAQILVITFTKAAAIEMEERFLKLTHGKYQGVCFGTFHAVYFHILQSSGYSRSRLIPAGSEEKCNYLAHILKEYGIEEPDKELEERLLREISRVKNSGGKAQLTEETGRSSKEDEILKQSFAAIYKEYGALMKEEHKLDFDDMIYLCYELLKEKEKIRDYWQHRFSYLLVDEFQDISPLQYEVLKILAQPQQNLFVVGDDDQSVYSFRGAGPDIMKQFLTDYPQALQVVLDTNYRSTPMLVKAAGILIADNKNRFAKQLKASRTMGDKAVIRAFVSKEDEISYLLGQLKAIPPKQRSDTAVICRTNRQTAFWAGELAKAGLPFCCRDKAENLFEHFIAKDLLAYLMCAGDFGRKGSMSREDFLRIMNRPSRYIRRAALPSETVTKEALFSYYEDKPYMQEQLNCFFRQLVHMEKLCPYLAIDYIRKSIGYDDALGKQVTRSEWKKRLEKADEIQQTAKACRSTEEWKAYMKICAEGITSSQKCGEESRFCLLTMHGSKGLEYDNVFLPDVSAKLLPGRRAKEISQLEEERRILYVAMTRARYRLEILYEKEPSPFLHKLIQSPYTENFG